MADGECDWINDNNRIMVLIFYEIAEMKSELV